MTVSASTEWSLRSHDADSTPAVAAADGSLFGETLNAGEGVPRPGLVDVAAPVAAGTRREGGSASFYSSGPGGDGTPGDVVSTRTHAGGLGGAAPQL